MNKENIKNTIEKVNRIILKYGYIIEFIMSLFLAISIYKIFTYKTYYSHISYKNIALAIISAIAVLYIIILNLKENIKKLEKMFLTFMIPIGMMFVILMVPGFVADEAAHMYRAYDVQLGNIVAPVKREGTTIPKALNINDRTQIDSYQKLMEKMNEKTDYNDTEEVWCPAEGYNAIMYIFSSIAFLIGRIFNINIFITMYLARIFNYIFFLFAGYYIIKLIPFGKLVLFVYMFNPMLIHQSAAISADSIINSITLLFIAYTLYMAFYNEENNRKEKILYAILAIAVSLAKYVYFPLVLLSLMLISKKKSKRQNLYIVTIIGICVILAVINFFIGNRYGSSPKANPNINMVEQVKYIIMHPIEYVKTFIKTNIELGEFYFMSFNGRSLGWLNINVFSLPVIFYAVLLVSTIWIGKNERDFNLKQKILVLATFLVIVALIFTGLYLTYTEVGAEIILGVQGRYFIPIVLLVFLSLISKEKFVEYKHSTIIYIVLLMCINISALEAVKIFFLK